MSVQPTKLKWVATGDLVPAEFQTLLPLDALLEAEEQWSPRRIGILRELMRRGVDERQWPQHSHWNWAKKALELRGLNIDGPLSPRRIMGMRCGAEWQGMILVTAVGHQTRLGRIGRPLLYADYVESAPWNLEIKEIAQAPRYRGVGWQLIEAAVRLSKEMEFGGRVGLHSLPQSESFYRWRCGMTDLGPDSQYSGLRYFEMTEEQARAFLREDRP